MTATERQYLPPTNLEAEQAVLGSMLIEKLAVERAIEIIGPEHFYFDAHRALFEIIVSLTQRNLPVDVQSVMDAMKTQQVFDACGGIVYLRNLMDAPSTAANIAYYCRMVEEKAVLRGLLDAGSRIQGLAYQPYEQLDEVVDQAEQLVFDVWQRRNRSAFRALPPIVAESMAELERRREWKSHCTGISTPFDDLNYMTAGLQNDDLIVVAARPGMGKTSWSMQLAHHAARQGVTTAVFSLEMSERQLVDRLLCTLTRTAFQHFRTGMVTPEEWHRLGTMQDEIGRVPLFIDDTREMTVMEMRGKCRRLKAEHGLGLVVIDYVQQLRSDRKTFSRNEEVSEVIKGCKTLAREMHVPVIALAQLNRELERRPDKRPVLSDIRESGQIEAESDLILFLYRDAYYNQATDDEADDKEANPAEYRMQQTEIIVAKNRQGMTGKVVIGFIPDYLRFEDVTSRYPSDADAPTSTQDRATISAPPQQTVEQDPFWDEPDPYGEMGGRGQEEM